MRIIAGAWRGRTIYPPKGLDTRPTIDRVRESLMSSLASLRGSFEDACVLDAFAGSGALGLEALSRGAAWAVFCEKDRTALAALQRNMDIVGVSAQSTPGAVVKRGDVLTRIPGDVRRPFDLVLLDPPYALASSKVAAFLDALAARDALAQDAIVSYEHAAADDVSDAFAATAVSWEHVQSKRYGETAIDIFRRKEA